MGLSVLLALEESAGKGGISWEMKRNDNKFPESKGAEPCFERSRTNIEGQTGMSHSQLFLPVQGALSSVNIPGTSGGTWRG